MAQQQRQNALADTPKADDNEAPGEGDVLHVKHDLPAPIGEAGNPYGRRAGMSSSPPTASDDRSQRGSSGRRGIDGFIARPSRHRPTRRRRSSSRPPSPHKNTASAPIFSGVVNSQHRLLFAQQVFARLLDRDALGGGARLDLPLHQRGQHPAGADRVAGDAVICGLYRHHLGQADEPVLGRDIGRLFAAGDEPVRRGNVDDRGPICSTACAGKAAFVA